MKRKGRNVVCFWARKDPPFATLSVSRLLKRVSTAPMCTSCLLFSLYSLRAFHHLIQFIIRYFTCSVYFHIRRHSVSRDVRVALEKAPPFFFYFFLQTEAGFSSSRRESRVTIACDGSGWSWRASTREGSTLRRVFRRSVIPSRKSRSFLHIHAPQFFTIPLASLPLITNLR